MRSRWTYPDGRLISTGSGGNCSSRSSPGGHRSLAPGLLDDRPPGTFAGRARDQPPLPGVSRANAASGSSARWRGWRPRSAPFGPAAPSLCCAPGCWPKWMRCRGVGHGCGHNLSGPASLLAGLRAGPRPRAGGTRDPGDRKSRRGDRRRQAPDRWEGRRLRGSRRRDDGARLRHAACPPACSSATRKFEATFHGHAFPRGRLPGTGQERPRRGHQPLRRNRAAPATAFRPASGSMASSPTAARRRT